MTFRQSNSTHLERAVDWLLDRQRSDGSWYAEFETDIARPRSAPSVFANAPSLTAT